MAKLFETDFIIQVTEGHNNSILALDELAKNDTFQNDLERITEPAVQSLEGEIEAWNGHRWSGSRDYDADGS